MLSPAPIKQLPLERTVDLLRAAGEPTRLRLLALLSDADLTVTDLIDILGQSQPRISRHLRLLVEGGLVERHQEGAWAYFRTADEGPAAGLAETLLSGLDRDDPQLTRDRERLDAVRKRRSERAASYFADHAYDWDALRSLHVEEAKVEAAMLELAGTTPFQAMLDLGTGTGRLLELFAPLYARAVGVDMSRDMLAVARANLDRAGLSRVQVRQGDIFLLPTQAGHFDFVTLRSAREPELQRALEAMLTEQGLADLVASRRLAVTLAVTITGLEVQVDLRAGAPGGPAIRGWAIDWSYGRRRDDAGAPVFAPHTWRVRSRSDAALPLRAIHRYRAAGRATIVARVCDPRGATGEARRVVELAGLRADALAPNGATPDEPDLPPGEGPA